MSLLVANEVVGKGVDVLADAFGQALNIHMNTCSCRIRQPRTLSPLRPPLTSSAAFSPWAPFLLFGVVVDMIDWCRWSDEKDASRRGGKCGKDLEVAFYLILKQAGECAGGAGELVCNSGMDLAALQLLTRMRRMMCRRAGVKWSATGQASSSSSQLQWLCSSKVMMMKGKIKASLHDVGVDRQEM